MILSATLSKPVKNIEELTGKNYTRIKIRISPASAKENIWFLEMYTKTQVFHQKMNEKEVEDYINKAVPALFKSCVSRTEDKEITLLANKKGKVTRLEKTLKSALPAAAETPQRSEELQQGRDGSSLPERHEIYSPMDKLFSPALNRRKQYLIPEGKPVPVMVRLGIMTAEGKVIASKYQKFRQINRFLEIIDETARQLLYRTENGPVSIVDFGSGKSYLTFAVHYYFTEICKRKNMIFGLDLKKDVIDYCSRIAEELHLENLTFATGDIAEFTEEKTPDIVITLHACDTATDYALNYAVRHHATAILSVTCCQHEINSQLKKKAEDIEDGIAGESPFNPLLKYGLIKERFSALVTDAVRGELLEKAGYRVQMLEFIDDSGSPKNLMIRAVKKNIKGFNWNDQYHGVTDEWGKPVKSEDNTGKKNEPDLPLLNALGVSQTLYNLLNSD